MQALKASLFPPQSALVQGSSRTLGRESGTQPLREKPLAGKQSMARRGSSKELQVPVQALSLGGHAEHAE